MRRLVVKVLGSPWHLWRAYCDWKEKRDLVGYAFTVGQFGPLPSLAERQERLWSYDARAGTLTLVEPDVEARARAGSF